ncbi:hypothetical protein SCP_0605660 [Sparassis crispa]|uniref:Uncharacterized protein n=1 Tax=Sparassis crispa TaxID=139825 RepID=A0A401GQT1_9APHY|nr:hypothetical protein SCP_0605660 [Sparassis crispa]GBE84587.1 hypothetical protein SCP_0605660 [Sparassis crispa]
MHTLLRQQDLDNWRDNYAGFETVKARPPLAGAASAAGLMSECDVEECGREALRQCYEVRVEIPAVKH